MVSLKVASNENDSPNCYFFFFFFWKTEAIKPDKLFVWHMQIFSLPYSRIWIYKANFVLLNKMHYYKMKWLTQILGIDKHDQLNHETSLNYKQEVVDLLILLEPVQMFALNSQSPSVPLKRSNKIYHISICIGQSGLSKQCTPRWDAAECSISSGSTLFATHMAIFRHNIG